MAEKISIDIDQLVNDIATCQSKITRMNELLNEIETNHFPLLKRVWQSSSSDALMQKYAGTLKELKKTIQTYNALNHFLEQVAETYQITERVNNLQNDGSSGNSSAFS